MSTPSSNPAANYLARSNIVFPGSSAQVDAAELRARQELADRLGLTVGGGAIRRASGKSGPLTLDTMPFGITLAHRARGGHMDMDNALSSTDRLYADVGNVMMGDVDVQALADGTPVMMHDTTVDRTTNGTGAPTTFNAATWSALRLKNLPNPGVSNEAPGFFTDFLDKMKTYGMVFDCEPKDAANAAAMVSAIQAAGLTKQALFASFTPSALVPAKNAGMKVVLWQWDSTKQASAAATLTCVNGGPPDYVGVDFTATTFDDAWLTTLINAGIKMVPWTMLRRSDVAAQRAKYQALGSDLAIVASNEPVYTAGMNPVRSTDTFATGLYDHGMIEAVGHTRATISGSTLKFVGTASQAMLLGQFARESSITSVRADITYDAIAGTGGDYAWMYVGCTNDKSVAIASTVAAGIPADGGMLCYLRTDGSFRFGKFDPDKTFTAIDTSVATAAVTAGQTVPTQFIRDGDNVYWKRLDTGHTLTGNVPVYKGGYLHAGKVVSSSATNVSFGNFVVA